MTAGSSSDFGRDLVRLARRDAVLVSGDDAAVYLVHPNRDRRRRAIKKLPRGLVHRWLSDGVVESDPGGGYVVSQAGRAKARRLAAASDGFAAQHHDFGERHVVRSDGSIEAKRANLTESPLAWLARRSAGANGFLATRELAAGERFRQDHIRATREPSLTSDWSSAPKSGQVRGGRDPAGAPDAVLAARDRVRDALSTLGPGLSRVVDAVCGQARGLDEIERGFGWPRRSGKVALKLALERLADHYGLP